jgi:CHAT domain-containing protein
VRGNRRAIVIEYTDVTIRVFGADEKDPSRHNVEAQIDRSGHWGGESVFDFDRLDAGRLGKKEYGLQLGEQLLNPSILRALEQAGVGQGKPVRLRLQLDDKASVPHWVRWERLYLRVGREPWPVAISPDVTFARYIPDPRPDTDPPADDVFRLLFVVANPPGLSESQTLDVEAEIKVLLEEFRSAIPTARFRIAILPGRSGLSAPLTKQLAEANWKVIPGHAGLDNISRRVHEDGGYHALHVVCHGNFNPAKGVGTLLLEDEQGAQAKVEHASLQSWIHPKLQLVVFQACRTAAGVPEGAPPFAGIAPAIVRFGVPAVVAMQDFILMSDARAFSSAFYRALLRDGQVDAAVNEGRRGIPDAVDRVESTIPALFTRLRSGRLWRPDPVRDDVWETQRRLGTVPAALPLKVVHHTYGLRYDPTQGPEGPTFDLQTRTGELIGSARLTCLTGPPGFDKTAELHRQFARLAKDYLDGVSDAAPFLLGISDLDTWARSRPVTTARDLRAYLHAVAAREAVPSELSGRTFVFLVDADVDLAEDLVGNTIESLLRLLDAFPDSHALMIYDETSLGTLRDHLLLRSQADNGDAAAAGSNADVQVLVIRPVEWPPLRRFLVAQGEPKLAGVIEDRQLTSVVGAPWIIAQLRQFARLGRFASSRADALGLIASSFLSRFDTRQAPRSCAEEALKRMAWQLQIDRTRWLAHSTVLSILSEVRDRRDFRLSALRDALIDCGVLARKGDEDIRFGYRALQSYFGARYLNASPHRMTLLEDITATLGRFSRMRHWEDLLITLAGMPRTLEERIALLSAIVAGSPLTEGEQASLAARMYLEMADSGRDPKTGAVIRQIDPKLQNDKLVRQIIEALAWRARPDIPRPFAERRQAIVRLAEMQHPDAVPHLVSFAADRFPPQNKFDNSGIRSLAVKGLLMQKNATLAYIRDARPHFKEMSDAWLQLADGHVEPMLAILRSNDEAFSPIAAFALASQGMEVGGPPLLETYFYFEPGAAAPVPKPNEELLWAITNVFGAEDATWLEDQVITRWLRSTPEPQRRLCFLIQKLGRAPVGSPSREYLDRCLQDEAPRAQDRALRALSKLNDPKINEWLIPLCHEIIRGNWSAVTRSGHMRLKETPPPERGVVLLQRASLEVLRDIGSEESIEIIRGSNLGLSRDIELVQLRYQVAEEMYWRLTGSLARETFTSA